MKGDTGRTHTTRAGAVESSRVKLSRVELSRVGSSRVESSRVASSRVGSSQATRNLHRPKIDVALGGRVSRHLDLLKWRPDRGLLGLKRRGRTTISRRRSSLRWVRNRLAWGGGSSSSAAGGGGDGGGQTASKDVALATAGDLDEAAATRRDVGPRVEQEATSEVDERETAVKLARVV